MGDFRLKVFKCAAKYRSFTKASEELLISQPAITKHIKELETEYQTRLFERVGNRLILTVAGELLLEHSEHILECYEKLAYDMSTLRNEHAGGLRIGASQTIMQYILPSLLAKYINLYPKVELFVKNGNSEEMEQALLNHEVHLALVEGSTRHSNLKYTPFLKDELIAVVNSTCSWGKQESITIEELKKIPLVLREHGSGTLNVFAATLLRKKVKMTDLNIRLHLGSTESIKRFLLKTDCMGIISIRSVRDELLKGSLKVLEIIDLPILRDFSIVQHHGQETGLADQFLRLLEQKKKEL